ncbi:hypothetical protein GCM10009087_07570 [Sphingomonas oligophenolica]|uniref:DUF4153 domain-containing protein n=1 Tax=Sphingomonas oligophenolica TaxID=301154 RepID=A0ABU9XXG3_9SPHN
MTDAETMPTEEVDRSWRLRPAILAAIGLIAAIIVQQLADQHRPSAVIPEAVTTLRLALAIGIGTAALALGFGMERTRLLWSVSFALLAGAVTGLIYFWSGGAPGWWFGDWRYASLWLSIAITVPLFQTARDEGRARFPYAEVHGHAWTNVVLWCACWAFTGIVFLLAWLLSALFDLIGLHFLRELLEKSWFAAALAGAAFGGALGLLRERDRIVRLLQRVVTAVLAVLAPVLGVGLLLFLVALPFTGLHALWEATKSTTPILLSCVIGALILANAVIGDGEDEELTNPVLRWGAMALGLAALPLCVIAAIATGLRIDQYGFTPDRLWALVFVILATTYGVAYFVSLVLGRNQWAARVRPANLRIAFIVAAVALFLATPILSFNAISTADQVARLESGRITPDKFDWAALAFDFGDPGKAALKRLAASKTAAIARRAQKTQTQTNRWDVDESDRQADAADALTKRLRVLPGTVPVPQDLQDQLTSYDACGREADHKCTLLYTPGATEAFAVSDACIDRLAAEPDTKQKQRTGVRTIVYEGLHETSCSTKRYRLSDGKWVEFEAAAPDAMARAALRQGIAGGAVEVRTVPRRQLFVGGVPVGDPFE